MDAFTPASMASSLGDIDLDDARDAYPDNRLSDALGLEERVRLSAGRDDVLCRALYDMLATDGFRAVERALLRAVGGFDIPARIQ